MTRPVRFSYGRDAYSPNTRTIAPILDVLIDLDGKTLRAAQLTIDELHDRTTNTVRYHPGYPSLDGAYELEPALPRTETPVVASRRQERHSRQDGLPGAFGDIAPDSWGIHVLTAASEYEDELAGLRSNEGADRLHPAYVLAGTSATLGQGALTFRYAHDEHIPAAADARAHRLDELPKLLTAARAFHPWNGDTAEHAVMLRDAGAASLGGARPKVPVLLEDGALGIAKLPSRRDNPKRHGVLPWEHVALTLAARADIRTPDHQLKTIDGDPVLVLRRFDRTGDPSAEGGQQRIGYISASTLTGAEEPWQVDYVDIAEAIARHSPTPDADRAELYVRIIVSIALGNTDDHARNHDAAFYMLVSAARLLRASDAQARTHVHKVSKAANTRSGVTATTGMPPENGSTNSSNRSTTRHDQVLAAQADVGGRRHHLHHEQQPRVRSRRSRMRAPERRAWHPILAAIEQQVGTWWMVDQGGYRYAIIRIVRIERDGTSTPVYRAVTGEAERRRLTVYAGSLVAAAEAAHRRFVAETASRGHPQRPAEPKPVYPLAAGLRDTDRRQSARRG